MAILQDIYLSPICRTIVLFFCIVGVGLYFLPAILIGEILDAFVISGALVYFARFWRSIGVALRLRKPDAAAIYLSGVALLILSVGVIRSLRFAGISASAGNLSVASAFLLGGVSSCIVISIYLLCVAPPFYGDVQLSAYAAIAAAVGVGLAMSLAIMLPRLL